MSNNNANNNNINYIKDEASDAIKAAADLLKGSYAYARFVDSRDDSNTSRVPRSFYAIVWNIDGSPIINFKWNGRAFEVTNTRQLNWQPTNAREVYSVPGVMTANPVTFLKNLLLRHRHAYIDTVGVKFGDGRKYDVIYSNERNWRKTTKARRRRHAAGKIGRMVTRAALNPHTELGQRRMFREVGVTWNNSAATRHRRLKRKVNLGM